MQTKIKLFFFVRRAPFWLPSPHMVWFLPNLSPGVGWNRAACSRWLSVCLPVDPIYNTVKRSGSLA